MNVLITCKIAYKYIQIHLYTQSDLGSQRHALFNYIWKLNSGRRSAPYQKTRKGALTCPYMYIYIYIHMYVCIRSTLVHTYTRTHTHKATRALTCPSWAYLCPCLSLCLASSYPQGLTATAAAAQPAKPTSRIQNKTSAKMHVIYSYM